jgi:hypothetical protein
MQNKKTDFPARAKRTAKTAFSLIATVFLVCLALAGAALACLFILDRGPGNEGERYTFSQRMKRYKVAGQFIWADLKDAVSRRFPHGTQSVSCSVAAPAIEANDEPESGSGPGQ